MEDEIALYQADLRRSYVGGGVGAMVSGLVWAAAALVEAAQGVATAYAVLFVGGMFIYPVGTLLCRYGFGREPVLKGNPGGRMVIETLPGMFVGLLAGWLFLGGNPQLAMPFAAMAVGAHYFSFRSAYGDVIYWLLGTAMVAVGLAAVFLDMRLPFGVAWSIAVLEIAFGAVLTVRALGGKGVVS